VTALETGRRIERRHARDADLPPAAQAVLHELFPPYPAQPPDQDAVRLILRALNSSDDDAAEALIAVTHRRLLLGAVVTLDPGDELIEAMRPLLRAQNDLLSDAILGQQGGVAVSTCDVALLEGGEALALVSADDGDLQAGFFADRGLRERISSQRLDGVADATWHKVRPTVGATFYFRARGGEVWRLEVLDATDGEVLVLAEPASAAEGR
jgi:hypothetical protein